MNNHRRCSGGGVRFRVGSVVRMGNSLSVTVVVVVVVVVV
jgi:hypothetical protein